MRVPGFKTARDVSRMTMGPWKRGLVLGDMALGGCREIERERERERERENKRQKAHRERQREKGKEAETERSGGEREDGKRKGRLRNKTPP